MATTLCHLFIDRLLTESSFEGKSLILHKINRNQTPDSHFLMFQGLNTAFSRYHKLQKAFGTNCSIKKIHNKPLLIPLKTVGDAAESA